MKSRVLAVIALVLVAAVSCSVDNSDAHDGAFADLPTPDGVELISTERSTYCSEDTCLFGDDLMTSTYSFEVAADGPTEREVIAAYVDELPSESRPDVRFCDTLDTDPAYCVSEVDHRASASFLVGTWFVQIDTLTWADGTYVVQISEVLE